MGTCGSGCTSASPRPPRRAPQPAHETRLLATWPPPRNRCHLLRGVSGCRPARKSPAALLILWNAQEDEWTVEGGRAREQFGPERDIRLLRRRVGGAILERGHPVAVFGTRDAGQRLLGCRRAGRGWPAAGIR